DPVRPIPFAWRSLRRELRYGELTTLVLALVLAVAALGAVATLGARVEQAMLSSAGELIGGDLGVVTRRAPPPELRAEAERLALKRSESAEFPTVLFANGQSQMVSM